MAATESLHRLRGLFADSVPDGWGLKVMHQSLRDAGIDPFRASPLALLRAVGRRGMGAPGYEPTDDIWGRVDNELDLDSLAADAFRLDADLLEDLPLRAGFRHVLIKFRSPTDSPALPAIELAYLKMASVAGLSVPGARLQRLASGEDALIVDRFDRVGGARRHAQTMAALLELDPAKDLADYGHLLELTRRLTGSFSEVLRVLRLAAFNVYAGNRDDHTKNVLFSLSPSGEWSLAPAYDLTWSARGTGYHAMSVDGESRSPGTRELQRVARSAGLDDSQADTLFAEVRAAVVRWPEFAAEAGVPGKWVQEIASSLRASPSLVFDE